jgi:hypothetical protein
MREVERIYSRFIWSLIRDKEQRNLTGHGERWRQEDLMPVNFPSDVQPGRRLRPGERQKCREVTVLYPFVEAVPTRAEIEYYQSLGDYALAADRQSDGKELGRQDATGQWGRFRAIQSLAAIHRYYLPDPTENIGRAEGEPMFRYDRRHYFVDGEGRDASGLAGHPRVRPELWRLAKTIEILGRLNCAPKAVLIGSEERWFRDTTQFRMWHQALKLYGVKLYVGGIGEVTEANCSIICMRVEALSAWLGPRSKNARAARRSRGEAYHAMEKFGLDYPEDATGRKLKDRCILIPEEWQTMRTLALLVDAGRVNSAAGASAWLFKEHVRLGRPEERRPCSVAFIRNWFMSPIPEGAYPCHTCETTACRVKLAGTMITDLDVTDNGVIRRYSERRDPLLLPIEIPPDMAIPPDVLEHVRARLIGRKPRTRQQPNDDALVSLFPSHLVRCVHCGTYVVERPPRQGNPRAYVESRRQDDELMVRLRAEGKSYQAIAALLQQRLAEESGRLTPVGKGRVHKRLQLLGINGGGLAENLQKVADFWEDPFRRRNGDWHLYCHCASVLALKPDPTDEERRRLDPDNHVVKRAGSLTLAAWPALWQACLGHPPLEEETESSVDPVISDLERANLARAIDHLQAEIDAVNRAWWQGEFGTRDTEEAKRQRDSLKGNLEAEKAAKTARRDALAAQIVRQKEEQVTAAQFAAIRARMAELEGDPSPVWRQEFVRTFVKQVTVDLATGEWSMETAFHWEELRRMVGKLGLPTADLVPPSQEVEAGYAFSWRLPDVTRETTTCCRSAWYVSATARGRLVLAASP